MFKEKTGKLYFKFKQCSGRPSITTELQALIYQISRATVSKYINELGLRSKLSKKFKVTTNSKQNDLIIENVLDRDFKATEKGQKCVSDITYIQTKEGLHYLTILINLYNRKLIGLRLSNEMSVEDTSLSALRMAVKNSPIKKVLFIN